MVGLRTLTPSVGVRIPLPQPDQKPAYRRAFFVWPEESACGNRSIRWANPGLVRTVGRRGREPSGPRAPGLSSALRSLSPPIGGLSVCRRTGADWRPLGSMGVRRARYRVARWCVRAAGPGERSAGATESVCEHAGASRRRRRTGARRRPGMTPIEYCIISACRDVESASPPARAVFGSHPRETASARREAQDRRSDGQGVSWGPDMRLATTTSRVSARRPC